jgi:hypothetical protein
MNDRNVETGSEYITKKSLDVWNTPGGAIVASGNTGEEKIQVSGPSGGNININNKVNSEFAPNNKQTLVHGDQFSTVAGNSYERTNGDKEQRFEGNFNIITGSENFFNNPIAEEWLEKNAEIAAAKAAPEYNYGAVGNNSETEYKDGGTPNEEGGGSVEGGNYKPSPAQEDIPKLMEDKAAEIATTEARMGSGGSVNVMSAKHFTVMAGTKAVTFDSGIMVPNARSVLKGYEVTDGEAKPVMTSVSGYESKDTSSAVPFGDIFLSASAKMRIVTGSGGLSIKSAGETNINTTGRLMLGGAEVSIAGGNKGNSGRITMVSDTDIYMEAGTITARNAPNINDIADNFHTFVTPQAIFTGNLHVMGDLRVNGEIIADGDIIAGGPGGISLLNHTHTDTAGTSAGTTSPPNS